MLGLGATFAGTRGHVPSFAIDIDRLRRCDLAETKCSDWHKILIRAAGIARDHLLPARGQDSPMARLRRRIHAWPIAILEGSTIRG